MMRPARSQKHHKLFEFCQIDDVMPQNLKGYERFGLIVGAS